MQFGLKLLQQWSGQQHSHQMRRRLVRGGIGFLLLFSLFLSSVTLPGCHMTCKECGDQGLRCLVGKCPNGCEPHPYLTLGRYCEFPDHCHTKNSARHCAVRSLYPHGGNVCVSKDYEQGFIKAYQDVLTGGTGKMPAVPPERYWTAHYRTKGGHSRADDWFSGYQAGSNRVKQTGAANWIQIATPNIARETPHHSNNVIPAVSSRNAHYQNSYDQNGHYQNAQPQGTQFQNGTAYDGQHGGQHGGQFYPSSIVPSGSWDQY